MAEKEKSIHLTINGKPVVAKEGQTILQAAQDSNIYIPSLCYLKDLNEIASLESECFSQDPWNVRMLAESFLSPHFVGVLLEEDGAVTAYGGIGVVEDEAELQLIATAEMYRRCGRGRFRR